MKKIRIFLPVFLAGVMILSACAGAGTGIDATQDVETLAPTLEPATLVPTEAASATAVPTEVTSTPLATMEQPASTATSIPGIPPTGGDLEALSAMLRYRVVDNAGNELGMVRDFIVNTCQAHILYIVLDAPTGNQSILVPYEAVSLNTDRPKDAAADELVVNIDASQLASVPTIDLQSVDFESATWDTAVMDYWKQNIAISLTSACNVATRGTLTPTLTPSLVPSLTPSGTVSPTQVTPVASPQPTDAVPSETPVALSGYQRVALQVTPTAPGTLTPSTQVVGTPTVTPTPITSTNVYKLVQASDLIGINVVDVRNSKVAQVRDALVLKSTGAVYYLIVQLVAANQQDADANLLAVPLGAVNLFYGTDFLRGTQVSPTATAVSGTPSAPAAGTPDTGKRVDTPSDKLDRPVLVLLVDLSVLQNAPAYSIEGGFVGQDIFDYWKNVFSTSAQPTSTPTP